MTTRNFAIAAVAFLLAHSATAFAQESVVQAGNIKPDWNCQSLTSPPAPDRQNSKVYRWTDEDGNVYYGDSVPDQYVERTKVIPQDRTGSSASPESHKTIEQIEGQRRVEKEPQKRTDRALRGPLKRHDDKGPVPIDGRAGPFSEPARETKLYIQNLQRRLTILESAADTTEVKESLLRDICETREKIERQKENLERLQQDPKHYRDYPEDNRYDEEGNPVVQLE